MSTISKPIFNPTIDLLLPWYSSKEDKRFSILLLIFLFLTLILAIIIDNLPKTEVDRKELQKPSAAIAKMMLEEKKKAEDKRELTIPKQPLPTNNAVKTEVKQAEVVAAEPAPVVKKPVVNNIGKSTAPAPKTAKQATAAQVAQAREVAKSSGLLAMKDDLAAMRSAFAPKSLGSGGGGGGNGGIKVSTALGNQGTGISRSQIVGKGTGGSGGIAMSAGASSGTGGGSGGGSGGGIGGGVGNGRGVAQVDSVTLGGKVVDDGGDVKAAMESSKSSGNRSEESIRSILDQNKASLYAIYNRALRADPALQGKVTFKLVIQPNGSVSACTIVGSDLSDESLKSKLISRMKLIDFGADNVGVTTTQWAIDFLPY